MNLVAEHFDCDTWSSLPMYVEEKQISCYFIEYETANVPSLVLNVPDNR